MASGTDERHTHRPRPASLSRFFGASNIVGANFGKTRLDDTEELGADLMAAFYLLSRTTPSQDRSSTNSFGASKPSRKPHTAVGDIDYEAVARRNSNSDLDLRYTVDAVARRPASLLCRPYLAGPQLSLVVGGGAWNFQATKRTI